MNKQEFEIHLTTYGPDLRRWPALLHESARPCFSRYPELVREAFALDAALDEYKVAGASQALQEAVLAQAAAWEESMPPAPSVWLRAAFMAATAIMGLWCGSLTLSSVSDQIALQRDTDTMRALIYYPTTLNEVTL